MNSGNELEKFKTSFILHSSRYNMYSYETLKKGSTSTHNRAVAALGKLQERVIMNPSIYSDLFSELILHIDPKVSLCACYTCLKANIHTQRALDTLINIGSNTPGISLICDFDIRGCVAQFKKKELSTIAHNEVDLIAQKMSMKNSEDCHTDEQLISMILKLQNINARGYDGRTLLIYACVYNRSTLAKMLIENGADINLNDSTRKSALHCAVITGNIDIIMLLINNRADVNAQDSRGFTALNYVKGNFSGLPHSLVEKMVSILVSHGAKTKQELS